MLARVFVRSLSNPWDPWKILAIKVLQAFEEPQFL